MKPVYRSEHSIKIVIALDETDIQCEGVVSYALWPDGEFEIEEVVAYQQIGKKGEKVYTHNGDLVPGPHFIRCPISLGIIPQSLRSQWKRDVLIHLERIREEEQAERLAEAA